ncbi:MAG: phosphoglycerate kinase [bacterium]|nr:phosphoglycerate kinase [bacterium]
MSDIKYIDDVELSDKTILARFDFNVSLNPNTFTIADDVRIRQSLPTIEYLLKRNNKLILMSHLGRPKGERDVKFSLRIICEQLKKYLPDYTPTLVDDFTTNPPSFTKENEILVLENIRFYPGEKTNDKEFAKKMADLADVFVNDAFGVCHREDASVVGVTEFLPSYGGLLLKKEIKMLSMVLGKPQKPFVAAIGGSKIETKIKVLDRMMELADHLIIGGALANTFLFAQGIEVGNSLYEADKVELAQKLLFKAAQNNTSVLLPSDCVVGDAKELERGGMVCKTSEVPKDKQILDIGPETTARIGTIIAKANTIVWNGPVGYFENPHYRHGTDFMYYAITNNEDAVSIVGGGDTLAAISKKEYLEKLAHISTGGGAMLEFIEKGTLPGIEALKK